MGNNQEIKQICDAAIKRSVAFNTHPLNVIDGILSTLLSKNEFKEIRLKCHRYLFEHRSDILFIITDPDK